MRVVSKGAVSARTGLVVAAAAILLLALLPAPKVSAAAPEVIHHVNLGDSYSAGNGAGGYADTPTDCRRSRSAWGMQVATDLQASGRYTVFSDNRACSGAIAWDVDHEEKLQTADGTSIPWQDATAREKSGSGPDHTCASKGPDYIAHFKARRLRPDECKYFLRPQTDWVVSSTNLVTLTIGGNDLGFADVVGKCLIFEQLEAGWVGALPYINLDKSCGSYLDTAESRLQDDGPNGLRARTKRVLEKIESRMDPDGLILLSSYPSLIDNTTQLRGSVPPNTAQRIRDGQIALDSMQQSLVTELDKAPGRHPHLVFTTPLTKFYGSEILKPGVSLSKPNPDRWFVAPMVDAGIGDHDLWYHPNKIGHTKWAEHADGDLPANPPANPVDDERRPLDLVFVIDTTGSMGDDIDDVKAKSVALLDSLDSVSRSWRVSVVSYRDFPDRTDDPGDYPAKVITGFSANRDTVADALNSLELGDGGDGPETMYSGIEAGLDLPWRPGVDKRVVVMTDAEALDPEPHTGLTADKVAAHALAVDPVQVVGVGVGGAAPDDLPQLQSVVKTAGGVVTSAPPGASGSEVVDAVKSVTEDPIAWVEGPVVGAPGQTVHLDASDSVDPGGTIESYAWDVDGDGTVDATRSTPALDVRFDGPFVGTSVLRVVSSSGRSNTVTVPIRISARTSGSFSSRDGFLRPIRRQVVLDTQHGTGAPGRMLKAKKALVVQVGGRLDVPLQASAIALDVSVSKASGKGTLAIYPCAAGRPKAPDVEYGKKTTTSRLVIAGLDRAGKVCFYSSKKVHVVARSSAYGDFTLDYSDVGAKRVLDTRKGVGAPKRLLKAKRVVRVTLPAGSVQDDARGVLVGVAVSKAAKAGSLSLWPCDAASTGAVTLRYRKGASTSTTALSGFGAGRKVCVRSSAATHLRVDLQGVLPAAAAVIPAVPTALLDSGAGVGAPRGPVRAGRTVRVTVPAAQLPDSLGGTVALGLGVDPTSGGTVRAGSCDAKPSTYSTLTFPRATPTSGLVLTTLGKSRQVCVVASRTAALRLVLQGSFALPEGGDGKLTIVK